MKTSLKLIPGAMLVLLFLITACNLYRRPIPDEMIGEHRIHRADGFMTQDYRLAINPVNDSVYDIKLWRKRAPQESRSRYIMMDYVSITGILCIFPRNASRAVRKLIG